MDAGVLLIRAVLGLTLAAHGHQKVFRGGRIAGTARWFDSMGMRPNGRVHAWAASLTEMGGGLLFAFGLLTPLAAAAFVGLMVVAGWTSHRDKGFFIVKSGWEYNLVLAAVPVGVAMIGPGDWSLDHALDLTFDPAVALALSAGVGLAAGVGLLATCYRPPAPDLAGS